MERRILTRGDDPYAVLAIGLASGLPALARSGPSGGFLVKSAAVVGTRWVHCGPEGSFCFAPADRRWRRRSGSGCVRAVAAARAARRAALKTSTLMRRSSGSVGRLRDSTASTYSHCLRMTVSESSRYLTGISRPSDGMSGSTRPAVHRSVGKPGGKPHTASILFRWPTDGQHVKARSYSETIWKPALVK